MALRMLVAAVTAAVLGVTAGCTSDDPGPAAPTTPSATGSATTSPIPSASPEPVELEVAVYGEAPKLRAYQRIARAFTRQRPGVSLELQTFPDATTAAAAAVAELPTGEGPDVFLADQFALPDLVATGRLQPVDTMLEDRGLPFGDEYQRSGLETFSALNRLQCMPAEMSPIVVYVNTRLVPRRSIRDGDVGLPTVRQPTWGWLDFLAAARIAASSDLLGPVKGAAVPVDLDTLTAFVRSAGSEAVDDVLEPTSLTLASDDAVAALASVLSVAGDPSLSPTAEELRRRDAVARFASGELGMFIGTRADVARLRAAEGLRFDVWPLPSFGRARVVAETNGFCIDSASDAVDAAADFVAFAVGSRGAGIAARSGVMVPSLLAAIHQDSFLQRDEQPRSAEMYAVSLRRTDPMPYSAAWPEVSAIADRVLRRLLDEPPADLLTLLQERMTRLDRRSERLFAQAATSEG